jgi:tRNA(Ile)-lysidine synthase
VLAHNADDQAETVLLQLLRGAGVKGLSAMPFRKGADRRVRTGTKLREASILRPLLDVPREKIEGYAKRHTLKWIEDESNADTAYQRNWLRHEILPLIARRLPGYRATLTRAASHFAEAAQLLDDLARIDAGGAFDNGTIPVAALRMLSEARAKNVLRGLIAARGWAMPEADRLEEALRQALTARADARVVVDLGACELRRYSGILYVLPLRRSERGALVTWTGEREIVVAHLGGVLSMTPRRGIGLSAARLKAYPVTIRERRGGERLQPDSNRPRRTVKNLLQEAGMPPWERQHVPFIYCGEELACIPGVAVDQRFQAHRGERSVLPVWRNLE